MPGTKDTLIYLIAIVFVINSCSHDNQEKLSPENIAQYLNGEWGFKGFYRDDSLITYNITSTKYYDSNSKLVSIDSIFQNSNGTFVYKKSDIDNNTDESHEIEYPFKIKYEIEGTTGKKYTMQIDPDCYCFHDTYDESDPDSCVLKFSNDSVKIVTFFPKLKNANAVNTLIRLSNDSFAFADAHWFVKYARIKNKPEE